GGGEPLVSPVWPSRERIQYLARHFTIKPVSIMSMRYGTGISYEHEAQTTLYAASEPAIHHALNSLAALPMCFEQYADPSSYYIRAAAPEAQHALRHLRIKIATGIESASIYSLLCCQLFINTELALDDFGSANQHFIRGLRIMNQGASRPYLNADSRVVAAQSIHIPHVDVFVIKLFLTPCPDGLTDSFLSPSDDRARSKRVLSTGAVAVIHANMQLAALARSTLDLLNNLAHLSPMSLAPRLVEGRLAILRKLQRWREHFATLEQSTKCQLTPRARLGTSFSVFFTLVLYSIVMLSTQPPGVKLQSVESIFTELLVMANELTKIKHEVNQATSLPTRTEQS
ncbi:hypothetical protein F4679DRAFT_594661, partial [Xylaria curta]